MSEIKPKLFASDANWIEGEAIAQLEKTAALEGISEAVGLPDLHPGRGIPIGAAFLSKGHIYPHLVGNDIGCGMALWQTNIKAHKVKQDRWVKRLKGLDEPWQGDRASFIEEHNLDEWDDALGTVGGGNHFAEVQTVAEIVDESEANRLGLNRKCLQIMVHSGSRGLGHNILQRHIERFGGGPLIEGTPEAESYIRSHDDAIHFASANRHLIAKRMLAAIGGAGQPIADMVHNSVVPCDGQWLHRKGAAPSTGHTVLIPGSRGHVSYVVRPTGDQSENLYSVAHGAGRKWNRSSARARLSARYTASQLRQTRLGSRVVCEDRRLLFEEAPMAYKDIDVVIADLVKFGLVETVAILKPVLTFKTATTS